MRSVVLPIHERLRGRRTMPWYETLRRHESWDPEQLRTFQQEKLSALLDHCVKNVPFYRKHRGASTLEAFPVLERDAIREHLEDMVADDYRGRVLRYSTGGSTGHPLVFYTDRDKEAWHNAHKLRCRAWHGVLPGARQADLWGSPIELSKQSRVRMWKDRRLLNQILLSAFDLTDARLERYLRFLAAFQPRLIYGYPTVIYRLALYAREHAHVLGAWRPRVVACTSEMLYDHHRAVIKEVFGCPVVNEYGSRDGGLIAHECPAGELHLAAEHVIVEVHEPDEQGVGDLLVTNLDAYGMPLVRYRLGDRGSLREGRCACGLPLPLMGTVAGRSNDMLVGAGGRMIHSLAPIYVLREMAGIRQFKLTQRADLSLLIEVVPVRALSSREEQHIRTSLSKMFGFEVPTTITTVSAIPPEKSGKYRWVVSQARATDQ
ncbi:MAG TPA: phenylacetate--CoA ligase family protein [Methylomirabilota bacterium]|nr:phenylacetate--CoA ligase family protein [Methylomirabilota bacterium]